MNRVTKIAIGSVVVAFAVLALKTLAWWMTGSVALLSDAMESTVNVVTAIAAFIAVQIAARPADSNHPYGHHKAEFFSAVLEGVMIIVAAVLILHEAYKAFMEPRMLEAPMQGLLVNGAATVLNGFWAWTLISQGRRNRSPALTADGHHVLTDVWSSLGVAIGVFLAVKTGWPILDPALAAIVALHILYSGWKVMTSSLSGLMDEALPEDTMQKIRETIAAEATGALEAHDLRTRHAGSATFIDFHLVAPGEMTVREAHDICDRIEAALKAKIGEALITIHVEPEHKAKHRGVLVV
ncbi:MAG: cation diffusion facilitator family transporter [Rhodoblastus sp.]